MTHTWALDTITRSGYWTLFRIELYHSLSGIALPTHDQPINVHHLLLPGIS